MGQDTQLLFSLKQLTNVESSLGKWIKDRCGQAGRLWDVSWRITSESSPFLGPEDSSGIQQGRMVKGYKTTQ